MKSLSELSLEELQNLTSEERWVLLGKCMSSCIKNRKIKSFYKEEKEGIN